MSSEKMTCPRCKGSGKVWDTAFGVNPVAIVFTLGFSLINMKERCPTCDGDGWIWSNNVLLNFGLGTHYF